MSAGGYSVSLHRVSGDGDGDRRDMAKSRDKSKKKTESDSPLVARRGRKGTWARVSGGPIFACIDMGTNSLHMIVCRAKPSRKGFETITRVKEIAPFFRRSLGAHFIDDVALGRAKNILKGMMEHAIERDATTIIAVATSAVRESRNGEEVLEEIRNELSLDARMISGKEEARLIYLGVLYSMPKLNERFAIVDIGGGSTEIISGDRESYFFAESYKLGAARLTQRFFKKGKTQVKPTESSIRALHEEVVGMLRPAGARVDAEGGFEKLIGTSGTIQALARLDRVQAGEPNEPLNGWVMPISRLEELVAYIEEYSLAGARIKGVSADRSQTILAGAIVLLETIRCLGAEEITVCTSALREGVVVDRFLQTGWLDCGLKSHADPRSESVHHILEKYEGDFAHAEQVARLAQSLFDGTRGILHDYSEDVGHILWAAAMLHDVGTHIARNGHHKHSYYLIRNGGLLGHSEEQVAMIAAVARYHRGAVPKETHEEWMSLMPSARPIVRDLSAILRVAEALDRSHRQVISELKIMMSPYDKNSDKGKNGSGRNGAIALVPILQGADDCLAEAWALNEKKAFFEDTFSVKLDLLLEASDMVAQPWG